MTDNKNNISENNGKDNENITNGNTSDKISGNDNISGDDENKKSDFDIVDFVIKHNTTYTVKKKRVWLRVVIVVAVFVLIIGTCVGLVLLDKMISGDKGADTAQSDNNEKLKQTLYGRWVSQDEVSMIISDKMIIFGDLATEYTIDKNVITININNQDIKMLFTVNGDVLTITFANSGNEEENTVIKYYKAD